MRLKERFISREVILASVDSFEIIEVYHEDKYLPSYLIYTEYEGQTVHIQVATDKENDNIRVVTAYKPMLDKWENDLKTRRKK